MWLVCYEYKSRFDDKAKWSPVVRRCETQRAAAHAYDSLLPGPNGSFGPIMYRNITLARVVCVAEEYCEYTR